MAETKVFLFTDLESSTRRWELDEMAMAAALARHDAIVAAAIKDHGGVWSKHTGDGVCAAFDVASDAVEAALAIQDATQADDMLSVRAGIHLGRAESRDGDWFGLTLNRCARLMGTAHGGQTVLSGEAAALLHGSLAMRDLGDHRLRDLTDPMRVFQVGAADFPPLRSLSTTPTNLPAQRSSFVGREAEMERLEVGLRSSRLVTLVGVGGTGKTRLALQATAEASSRFSDGAFLIELAPLRDPIGVARAVAEVVGVVDGFTEVGATDELEASAAILERLVAWTATRAVILMFDNCEHLIGAAADVVDRLLAASPGLVVIATSREPLMIEGELIFPVPGLAAARQLFEDRARSARPSFVLDEHTTPQVDLLCERLDGIPLAIELAAARLRALSLEQITQRLDDTFRLLTGGSRTALERHQTLAGTIRWSFDLLTPAEQRLFAELGVFVGGATLNAIETVCTPPERVDGELVDLVQQLVDKSLVLYEDGPGGGRYRMLEIVLQYAVARLAESEEAIALRDRHLSWARGLVHPASKSAINVDWTYCRILDPEHANLDRAFTWAVESGNGTSALMLGFFTSGYWRGIGLSARGREWLSRSLEISKDCDPVLRAGVLLALINLRQLSGDYQTALADLDEVADRFSQLGVPLGVAYARFAKARALDIMARYDEADVVHGEALALFDQEDDLAGRAWSDFNRAWVRLSRGDLDGAAALTSRLIAADPEAVGIEPYASGLVIEGSRRILTGEVGAGRRMCQDGLDLLVNGVEHAYCSFLWAWVELSVPLDLEAGEALLRSSLEESRPAGALELLESQLAWSAVIATRRGDRSLAAALFMAASGVADRTGIKVTALFVTAAQGVRAEVLAGFDPAEAAEIEQRVSCWSLSEAADAALAALA